MIFVGFALSGFAQSQGKKLRDVNWSMKLLENGVFIAFLFLLPISFYAKRRAKKL